MQPTLTSQRLVLRPFHLSDAPHVQRLAGAPEIARYTLHIPHPYPDGLAERWIGGHAALFANGQQVAFAITEGPYQPAIGSISMGINQGHRNAEMGYWLGLPFWGKGYMSEAARQLRDFGFRHFGLHRIMAQHLGANRASGRVMEKIGMRYEGTQRQHALKDGIFHDLLIYGILRSEWQNET